MPNLLKNLRIRTLGSVDSPANQEATVVLFKRDDTQDPDHKEKGGDSEIGGGDWIQKIATFIKSIGNRSLGEVTGLDLVKFLNDSAQEKEGKSMPELSDEIRKSLPEDVRSYLEELEKTAGNAEKLQKQVDELTKKAESVDKLTKKVEELEKGNKGNKGDKDPEEVLKGLPENVRKMIEDSHKRAEEAEKIAKAEMDRRLTTEYVEKAKGFTELAIKPEEFGPVLKSIATASSEAVEKVLGVLKAANETVMKNNLLLKKLGSDASGDDGDSAWGKVVAKAKELVLKNSNMTEADAIAQVLKESPDLYEDYKKELEVE